MPLAPAPSPRSRRPSARALALLTLLVLLAHGAVLHGAPVSLGLSPDTPPEVPRRFLTRSIHLAAAPEVAATVDQPLAKSPLQMPVPHSNRAVKTLPSVPTLPAPSPGKPVGEAPSPPALEPVDHVLPVASALPSLSATVQEPIQLAAAAPVKPVPEATPPGPQNSLPRQGVQPRAVAIPAPVRLLYDIKGEIKGFPYIVNGDLSWQHDQKSYQARLEISHFLLGSRVQTSKGALTAQGLEPIRFGDKVRSEVAAHFERSKGKVSFSANTPDAALQPGAQDQLSVFIQMAALLGGDSAQFRAGSQLSFQAVGPRSAEQWVFDVGGTETLDLPGGTVQAIKLTRSPNAEFDSKGEIWLAPGMGYMPVRIRLTQANGDFADQLWKTTEKPRTEP